MIELELEDVKKISVKLEWEEVDEEDKPKHSKIRNILKTSVDVLIDEMMQLIEEYNAEKTEYKYSQIMDCLEEINDLFGDDFILDDFKEEVE